MYNRKIEYVLSFKKGGYEKYEDIFLRENKLILSESKVGCFTMGKRGKKDENVNMTRKDIEGFWKGIMRKEIFIKWVNLNIKNKLMQN